MYYQKRDVFDTASKVKSRLNPNTLMRWARVPSSSASGSGRRTGSSCLVLPSYLSVSEDGVTEQKTVSAAAEVSFRAGFTHEKPRAERDGKIQNRTSSPAFSGAPVSEPGRAFAEPAERPRCSRALALGFSGESAEGAAPGPAGEAVVPTPVGGGAFNPPAPRSCGSGAR
jgi:hypothetical protein